MNAEPKRDCCGSGSPAEAPRPKGSVFEMADAPRSGPAAQPAPAPAASCCGSGPAPGARNDERPGYRVWPFVEGWIETPVGPVPKVKPLLDRWDVLGRWQMRWGIGRERYRIAPGLYAVGNPASDSPVVVTANYKMTFDVLRRDVAGLDAWVLVLETYGINVWCAAGKGTFGTTEIVRRVRETRIEQVVTHRRLILPQLGAPGVSAHEVRKGCGFSVVYGPVRARDIRRFLAGGMKATPAMRRVTFPAVERLALTPVELVGLIKPTAWIALGAFVIGGIGPWVFSPAAAWHRGLGGLEIWIAAVLAGAVATPVLLPWLPWRAFSVKGALVGAAVALWGILTQWETLGWLEAAAVLLAVPAASSYAAMKFTGSTPFTSPSGVEKEMRRAIPFQAAAAAAAVALWIGAGFAG